MSLLQYFHPVKRATNDSGGLPDPSGLLCSKFFSPTIKVVNVEVRGVRESQDTPSRSPYHIPVSMLARILWLSKTVGLIYDYINYNARADACAYQY